MRWSQGIAMLCLLAALAGAGLARGEDLAAARQNYDRFCAVCHGKSGKGDGPAGMTLAKHPRDFTDCPLMKTMSDETLFKAIKEGGPAVNLSKDMQPWGDDMSDEQIHDLVALVRSFCTK